MAAIFLNCVRIYFTYKNLLIYELACVRFTALRTREAKKSGYSSY